MAAGDASVADSLDTLHHEMDSVVHGHHVYKSVRSPVIGEQFILEKEPVNPHDKFAVAVIKDSQIVSHIQQYFKKLFTDHVVFYYTRGLCHLSYYWEKDERKRLNLWKCHTNKFIMDP